MKELVSLQRGIKDLVSVQQTLAVQSQTNMRDIKGGLAALWEASKPHIKRKFPTRRGKLEFIDDDRRGARWTAWWRVIRRRGQHCGVLASVRISISHTTPWAIWVSWGYPRETGIRTRHRDFKGMDTAIRCFRSQVERLSKKIDKDKL